LERQISEVICGGGGGGAILFQEDEAMKINNIKNCNIKFNITSKNIEKSGCEVIFVSVPHKLFATIFKLDDHE